MIALFVDDDEDAVVCRHDVLIELERQISTPSTKLMTVWRHCLHGGGHIVASRPSQTDGAYITKGPCFRGRAVLKWICQTGPVENDNGFVGQQ